MLTVTGFIESENWAYATDYEDFVSFRSTPLIRIARETPRIMDRGMCAEALRILKASLWDQYNQVKKE